MPLPPRTFLFLLLALAVARGVMYASFVPPWQAPDESPQFERARAAQTAAEWNSTSADRLPWYDDLVQSLFAHNYWDFLPAARQPYAQDALLNQYIVPYRELYGGLYGSRVAYAVIGLPLFLTRNQDITLQLYLVRLNTVLMNAGVILLALLITRTIFPNDRFLVYGVPILILFNPQHTHMLSTVNNGNLAELLTAAALYFMVKGVIKGFSWQGIIAVLGFSILAMWAKATAYFLPFALGALGLFYLWQYRRRWRWLLSVGVGALVVSYLFLPERLTQLTFQAWGVFNWSAIHLDSIVPVMLFRSFWAVPGWLTLHLHPFWYQAWGAACILALLGLIIAVVSNREKLLSTQFRPRLQALVVLAVAAVVSIFILLAWSAIANTIVYRQGRSIYPVIIPISIFLMLGWRQLIPACWRNFGLLVITAALFLFDSLVLFGYIIPFFYSRY